MTNLKLAYRVGYQGAQGSAKWRGCIVDERQVFTAYLQSTVRERLEDIETTNPLESLMRGVATTGMATEFLERMLAAIPEPLDWEIGEAVAECVLADDESREIVWPWNQTGDRRTPRASLPGPDLVGFCRQGNSVLLLFGEVKTSSDRRVPPGVMGGRSGLTWQIGEAATRIDLHHTLLKWLRRRCLQPELQELFQAAVTAYLQSLGRKLLIIGVLVRDTPPDELDVKGKATDLASRIPTPTQVEVFCWYLPVPIAEWPALLRRGAQ